MTSRLRTPGPGRLRPFLPPFGLVLLGALALAAPALAAPALAADAPRPPDFSGYQSLLDDYLTITSKPGEPLETRFHYRDLNQDDRHVLRLNQIHAQLFDGVAPSKMSHDERLAWAINGYNFLVLEAVTENFYNPHPTRPTSFPVRVLVPRKRVQEIKVEGKDLFVAPLVEVEGKTYDLNTFERTFVFEGFDHKSGGTAPKALDPRAHFALVCAAQGCPPLQPRAYRADSLDAQLDFAARSALASPHHLQPPTSSRLWVSSIFNWYAADFGGPAGAFAFIVRYAPGAVKEQIAKRDITSIWQYLQWDWTINQTPLPEYVPPTFEESPVH